MYKLKSYNYYKNLIQNYNILYLNNLINNNNFIIFFNYSQLSNLNLLNLKNEIIQENCISLVLNKKYIHKIFSNCFKFLSSHMFCIFISDFNKFLNIIKLLNNITFFYSFKKFFSCILNKDKLLNQFEKYKNFQIFHYIIFKLICNIIILFIYYITLIIKYLK